MPAKKTDTVKLNLRLPKALHRRLVQDAKRDNVSLNTEILNQLVGYGSVRAQAEKVAADSHTLKLALEILTRAFGKPEPTNDAELDERMRAMDAVRVIFGGVGDPAEVELGLRSLTIRTGSARKSEQTPVSPGRGLTLEKSSRSRIWRSEE